jgi:hypothetical protein
LSKIAGEVNALDHVLLPPAITLDVNGKNNICTNTQSDQVENRYTKSTDEKGYVLAVNVENRPVNSVQFTVEGLQDNAEIQVLFENRTITSGAGTYVDTFPAYGRHVYQLPVITENKLPIPKTGLPLNQLSIFYSSSHSGDITFTLNGMQNTMLQIYNLQGQLVNTLQGIKCENRVIWTWNRKDGFDNKVSLSTYVIKIEQDSGLITKKFVVFE